MGTDDPTMPPAPEQPESDELANMRSRDLLLLLARRQQGISCELAALRADLSLCVSELQSQGQRLTLSEMRQALPREFRERYSENPPPAPGAADL